MFLSAFTSADIIFHKLLELHSTLTDQKDFCHKVSFFNRFTQPPLNGQNPLSVTNFFCRCSLSCWEDGRSYVSFLLDLHLTLQKLREQATSNRVGFSPAAINLDLIQLTDCSIVFLFSCLVGEGGSHPGTHHHIYIHKNAQFYTLHGYGRNTTMRICLPLIS